VDAITVSGLRKRYGSVEAVAGVDFSVSDGECVALLGANGAGKTTTLEILEAHQRRDAGAVSVLGVDPEHPTRRWRQEIGIVLQGTAVDPYLTVRETLQRTAGFYPHPRDPDEVLSLVGLEGKATTRISKLSGGQQRRLDVAHGIIGNPRLLFLDEPTTGFDPSARRGAWDLVRDLRTLGTTIVLTTHYMDEAQALADRIVVLGLGRVVAEGTPDDLGGRDTAELLIRFRLPDGTDPATLPVAATTGQHGSLELRTTDDVATLHRLTTWSLEQGIPLIGLTAARPSLEDIYLSLVADAAAAPGADPTANSATTGATP
jgi:ABC-2 type transport system ATP-binding protein